MALARSLLLARARRRRGPPHAESALVAARAAGETGLEVEALTTVAFLDEIDGDRDAAADRLGAALRLARAAGEPVAELRAHYALASLHYYNGDVAAVAAGAAGGDGPGGRERAAVERARGRAEAARTPSRCTSRATSTAAWRAAEAPESPPPDVAAARLAAVSCYAAVAGGLPGCGARVARLRDSWDADPQVALVAGGCEADLPDLGGRPRRRGRRRRARAGPSGRRRRRGGVRRAVAVGARAGRAGRPCGGLPPRRDDDGAAAAVRQRGGRCARGSSGSSPAAAAGPGDLGPEGRAWHARALAEHARLQRRARPSRSGSGRSTPSATATSTSRPAATGGWPLPWSPRVTATPRGPTPGAQPPRRSGWGRSRSSGPSRRP